MIRDLTDAEARIALPCKWGEVDADVIPAWVAEMDYALAPPIVEALHAAVDANLGGYPSFDIGGELGTAYAGFARPPLRAPRRPRARDPGRRRDRRASGSRSTCSPSGRRW